MKRENALNFYLLFAVVREKNVPRLFSNEGSSSPRIANSGGSGSKMPPTIHLVRHAQGFHNLNEGKHFMRDPLLTPLGEEQCAKLREEFPYLEHVSLVVASPLKRTVYTALHAFHEILFDREIRPNGPKIVALPELQETSDMPCDTGSDLPELGGEFLGKPVDLTLVRDGWNSKVGKWAPTGDKVHGRAREARLWLMNRPEDHIVVVTHGGFLHYFTEDWADHNKFCGEFRSLRKDLWASAESDP